jgi:TPR repeat protein
MDYISFKTAMSLTGMAKSTLWRAIRERRVRHIVAKPPSGHAKARIDLDSLLTLIRFDIGKEERAHILAADTGNAQSQLEVALMLLEAKNPEQAVPWLNQAAQQGLADAMCHLGQCLVSGEGVEPDLEAARTWLRHSAERGHPIAAALLRGMEEQTA